MLDVGVKEALEFALRFVGQDGEFGGDSVLERVARGAGFTCGCLGTAGFGAVGAGGVGFKLRRHKGPIGG